MDLPKLELLVHKIKCRPPLEFAIDGDPTVGS